MFYTEQVCYATILIILKWWNSLFFCLLVMNTTNIIHFGGVKFMNQTKQNPLATEPIGRLIAKFAIPSVISLLVNSLYNIVDQIFIGRGVGYLGNGATNVVFPITIIALAFALLVGDGAASYLSLKLGEGKKEIAQKGVSNAILMLTAIGIIFLIMGSIFLKPLVLFFGATDIILPFALEYGRIIIIGLPFVIIGVGLNSMIRADGNPRYAMLSMIIGAIINTVLDPIFIFGLGMGVKGAAIATVLGQLVTCILSLAYINKFKNVKVTKQSLTFNWKISKIILSFGISSFITQIAITIVIAVTNNMLTIYGAQSSYGAEIPLTALGIIMKVNQIMISIVVGIAIGAQPIIGYNYGAGNYHRVKKTFQISITLATIVTVVSFLCFSFFPQAIINLFGSEDGLYNEFALKCLHIFMMLCILNGFQIVAGIFFQALGKPLKSAIVSLSRQIVFMVPSAILLPRVMGVEGVLWAGPIADSLAFILAFVLILFEMKDLSSKKC